MKTELSLQDRVDRLLVEGTVKPRKWMAVHGYVDPPEDVYDVHDWHDEWEKLRAHHYEEMAFLFEVIEELRTRLKEKEERNDD